MDTSKKQRNYDSHKMIQIKIETYNLIKQMQETFKKETDGGILTFDQLILNHLRKDREI